jgi:hypothetical protein
MQPDGTIRAMYNRSQKGEYSIRDGKFTANGNPTPPQHKCGANFARANQAEKPFRIVPQFRGNVPRHPMLILIQWRSET